MFNKIRARGGKKSQVEKKIKTELELLKDRRRRAAEHGSARQIIVIVENIIKDKNVRKCQTVELNELCPAQLSLAPHYFLIQACFLRFQQLEIPVDPVKRCTVLQLLTCERLLAFFFLHDCKFSNSLE